MDKEKQRVAIAEACGWREAFPKHGKPHEETKRGGILLPYYWVNENTHERKMDLPDFCNDLNACHEMEKVLDNTVDMQESDLLRYYRILSDICCEYPGTFVQSATASQRCEAFLKTINKWESTPSTDVDGGESK